MSGAPRTINGKLIHALARRDSGEFDFWYLRMRQNAEAQEALFEMYYGVFGELAVLRFPPGVDIRNIVKFLVVPRVSVFPALCLPVLEAEALIRSALGERGLVDGIPGELAIEIWMQLITYLCEDLELSDAQLCDVIGRAEARVASM
jgi:hypothetical protein